jgi:hypothetical protein
LHIGQNNKKKNTRSTSTHGQKEIKKNRVSGEKKIRESGIQKLTSYPVIQITTT